MSLARNTLVQATLTLGSRVLGFVRDMALAARFGQGPLERLWRWLAIGALFGGAFLLKPPLGGGALACAAFLARDQLGREATAISVSDVNGKEIASEQIKDFSGLYLGQIDVKKSGAGVYFVRVTQSNDGAVRRVQVD